MRKVLLILFGVLVVAGTLSAIILFDEATQRHHTCAGQAPINVPDDGSNHNALAIGLFIAAGICVWKKCWEPKPVKAETSLVPEIPKNEYTLRAYGKEIR